MKNPAHWIVLAALTAVTSSVLLQARSGSATRLVTAEISVGGEVLLRASTSDDGRPDADAVWEYLEELRFAVTDAFDPEAWSVGKSAMRLHGTPREETAPERARTGRRPRYQRDLELAISYGGTAQLFELELLRGGDGTDGRGWRVDPAVLGSHFELRRISRREARLLEDPDRRK